MTTGSKRATTPLALLAALCLLAGCGGGDGGSGSNDVTVWMYPVIADPKANSAHWAKVEKDFEAAHPGTRLTIEEQPWENRDEKLATAFGSGKGPDVVLLNPDQVPQYLASGALRPVDKAVEGIEESFLPNALKALSDDGKLYAVPIYHTVTTTLYNKRLLDRAGIAEPPATWDEVRAAAPKLKRIGVAALDYSASNEATLNLNFYPLLWQAGGRVFSEDGRKAAFNGPEGVAALTFLTDLYKAGALPRTALTNTNIFADHPMGKQQAAMGLSHTLADADLARRDLGRRERRRRQAPPQRRAGLLRRPRRPRPQRPLPQRRGRREVPRLHGGARTHPEPRRGQRLPLAAHRRDGAQRRPVRQAVPGGAAVRLPR
ncbi:ABC transporter substrate-binding protein [Streptomyces sudanensis]|uniref:ABC transporter substrate-binding protein n=1 Tax=Streptomyces sudanensis TaxID=436397 RepID=UPI0020CE1C29|nr:sugar ABC transporter substrate-binding protein [Streptomyces sudanensis]MCP9959915.1 sugar ABC transporter substrate-binding protein [Streptomyces sudanensis]